MLKMFSTYENLNIFIERDDSTYQDYGRNQSLEQCVEKNTEILRLLTDNNIQYISVKMSPTILDDVYYEVIKYNERNKY